MINNKGQSALEYLMTYGWALVVIVIVIAALFAFGIFNPPAAGTCSGLDKMLYKDHTLTSGGVLTLALANGSGSSINNVLVVYGGDCTDAPGESDPGTVATGADFSIVSGTLTDCPTTGSYSVTAQISYTNIDSGLQHTETATCTGSV